MVSRVSLHMRARPRAALTTLGFAAFVLGTAELVVVGVLDRVARALHTSISSNGLLVTAYALGISIGGPLLAIAAARLDRRLVLGGGLALFAGGNGAAALAHDLPTLVAARALTGALHGLIVGVALSVAASLVPTERQGRAVATVVGGITVAIVVGVPLGTAVGDAFGWRAAFVLVALVSLVALAGVLALVPGSAGGAGSRGVDSLTSLGAPVAALLGLAFLILGGQFAAFTYITPFLRHVTGVSAAAVSAFLLAYGLAAAAGTLAGGRAADRSASRTLIVAVALLVGVFACVYLLGRSAVAMVALLTCWGVIGFGLVPALQLRIMALAGRASGLAATLGVSAVNLGIAAGSVVGGLVVAGAGIRAVALAALVSLAAALPGVWWSRGFSAPSLEPAAVPGQGRHVGALATEGEIS